MKRDELIDMEPRVALILTEMEQGFRIDVHTLMNLKGSSELTLSSLNKELQDKSEKAWNSDIRTKNNYGAAKRIPRDYEANQGGGSPVYLV